MHGLRFFKDKTSPRRAASDTTSSKISPNAWICKGNSPPNVSNSPIFKGSPKETHFGGINVDASLMRIYDNAKRDFSIGILCILKLPPPEKLPTSGETPGDFGTRFAISLWLAGLFWKPRDCLYLTVWRSTSHCLSMDNKDPRADRY